MALQCAASARKAGWIGKEADAAFALCEQALAIDPNNVRALMALEVKFLAPALLGVSGDPKGDLQRADELDSKALALDPDWTFPHDQKGWVLLAQGRNDEAVAEFERALALDPSSVDAESGLAWVHLRRGEYDKSLESFDRAILSSPHDPALAPWYAGKETANFGLKRYDQAIEQARQAIAINPNYIPWAHTVLVAALALTGHDAEARQALQRYLALPSTGPLRTIAAWKAYNESQHGAPSLSRGTSGCTTACARQGCRKSERSRFGRRRPRSAAGPTASGATLISRSQGSSATARTPDLPEAVPEVELSAHLRRSRSRSRGPLY